MQIIRLALNDDKLHLVVQALREKAQSEPQHAPSLHQLANDFEASTYTILHA